MLNDFPKLEDIFPFEYKSGGYFRLKGVPKKKKAPILHGEEAIGFVYQKLKESILTSSEDCGKVENNEIQDSKA
jgi:hypothetical protein